MGKNEKTPITVNDVEYFVEDFNEQQVTIYNHLVDLDRKLNSARFNVDQLAVGRDAFANLLTQALQSEQEKEADE